MSRFVVTLFAAVFFTIGSAMASNPVNIGVDTTAKGFAIPAEFSGLSFEIGSERSNNVAPGTGYLFCSTNSQLICLFTNIGIKNIRIGGGSVDTESVENGTGSDGFTGVSNFFDFAKIVDANVVYTFRMFATNASEETLYQADAEYIANYIAVNFPSQLDSFAIGNEPNFYDGNDPYAVYFESSNTNGYIGAWQEFASAITNDVPGAVFAGPDTGDENEQTNHYWNGESYTDNFADYRAQGKMTFPIHDVLQHNYVAGATTDTNSQDAINAMLSASWDTGTNQWLYNNVLSHVINTDGWNYRMTEADDYLGGVTGASDRFASALWALDYMHWWAAHSCSGVNFHNKFPNATCLIYYTNGNFEATAKGLGILAFNTGAAGLSVETSTITNQNNINVTAYSTGDASDIYVTIINKTHGPGVNGGTNANVTIFPTGFTARTGAYYMMMSPGPTGIASDPTGTFGGGSITNNAAWHGTWTSIGATGSGQCSLTVPATSAAVVHIY